jgi:uncharacterized membrane protein
MVVLCTIIIRIPSIKGGYINFGDIMIFITSAFLGRTAGLLAGGIGSALADILAGYSIYAPATLIIKGLEGLFCAMIMGKMKKENTNIPRLVIALVVSAAWMFFGYFMYEYEIGGLLFANQGFGAATAILNLPGNVFQGFVSAAAAIPFILAIKRTHIQEMING